VGTTKASQTQQEDIIEQFEKTAMVLKNVKAEISKVVLGQNEVVDNTLVTLLCGGHVLLIGVPGLAKTLLVETIATVTGLDSARVQCTPDLMPSDLLGSEVLEENEKGKRHFRFISGPIFTQFLMSDEINRASPRTQSALLQAMQEKEISVSGHTHPLPQPFHVLATQNPLEQEGTYPLPEAQLDRFLMQIDVAYPDEETERAIVLATSGNTAAHPKAILNAKTLIEMQKLVRDMPVGDSVVNAILKLVRSCRPGPEASEMVNEYVSWAPGPRASQGLMLAVRARALLDGRATPSVEDVIALAVPVLQHRMALNFRAQAANMDVKTVIVKLCEAL
jgi:MoxR-like ATPase